MRVWVGSSVARKSRLRSRVSPTTTCSALRAVRRSMVWRFRTSSPRRRNTSMGTADAGHRHGELVALAGALRQADRPGEAGDVQVAAHVAAAPHAHPQGAGDGRTAVLAARTMIGFHFSRRTVSCSPRIAPPSSRRPPGMAGSCSTGKRRRVAPNAWLVPAVRSGAPRASPGVVQAASAAWTRSPLTHGACECILLDMSRHLWAGGDVTEAWTPASEEADMTTDTAQAADLPGAQPSRRRTPAGAAGRLPSSQRGRRVRRSVCAARGP